MAFADLTALQPPFGTKELTLPNLDVVREIKLPKWARRVSLRFVANGGKYASTGVDDVGPITEFQTVAADLLHTFNIDHGARAGEDRTNVSIFVAGDANAVVLRLTIEMGV